MKSVCVGWEAIRRILSFPTSSLAISPSASSPSIFFTLSFPRCPPPPLRPISPLPSLLRPLYLSLTLLCPPPSFMFGDSRATPPHRHGHACSVRRCVVCACVDCLHVCVCVHAQEDQAADSWAKAQTLLREGDSKEESGGLKKYTKGYQQRCYKNEKPDYKVREGWYGGWGVGGR